MLADCDCGMLLHASLTQGAFPDTGTEGAYITLGTSYNLSPLITRCTICDVHAGYRPEASANTWYPNEVASDFAFIPFGGGVRKCIGDQFALFEATVAMAMLLRKFTFRLAGTAEEVRLCFCAFVFPSSGISQISQSWNLNGRILVKQPRGADLRHCLQLKTCLNSFQMIEIGHGRFVCV